VKEKHGSRSERDKSKSNTRPSKGSGPSVVQGRLPLRVAGAGKDDRERPVIRHKSPAKKVHEGRAAASRPGGRQPARTGTGKGRSGVSNLPAPDKSKNERARGHNK